MSSNPKPANTPIPPLLVLFIGIFAVSTASIFIRFAQREVDSLTVAAWRIVVASLIIAPFAVRKSGKEIMSITKKDLLWLGLSGVCLALHFASWITSLEYTTVAASVVLVTTTPLWVALFSVLVYREKFPRNLLIGLLISLIGGGIVGMGEVCRLDGLRLLCDNFPNFSNGNSLIGNLLALIGAFCAAAYLLIGKKLRSRVSLLSYTFLVYGTAGILLFFMAIFAGSKMYGFSPITYIFLLSLAFIPQVIGHSSFNWALSYLSTTYVSIALLGEPVGSTILAILFLSEIPSNVVILGGILILSGIYIATKTPVRQGIEADAIS